MSICISIDPGITATGWALWSNGECIETGTIRPKGDTDLERFLDLKRRLVALFMRITDALTDNGSVINIVAVEKFQGHHHRPNMLAMMKCAGARMLCLGVADDWAQNVIEVNKRTAPKSDAEWLCMAQGVEAKSKDARDAVHLGIVAGFDRK